MEQRTRPCTFPCKLTGSVVIVAETRMNSNAHLGSKAHLITGSCYQGEIPNFYCAHYLLLQGVEEQPATRRNLSSQARIFSRNLGPNSELFSLLACPFTSQHLPTSFPAQESKLFIKKKKKKDF